MQIEKKEVINMGIDFGTSYSKVCWEDKTTKKKNYVELVKNNSTPEDKDKKVYYINTRVFYDNENKIFYYVKPEKLISKEIKYFKYSIIDGSLRSNDVLDTNLKTSPEELCCIFFIACLIKQSKKYIKDQYEKYGVKQFDWYITMGVPIDNYSDKYRPLYDRILILAIFLSEKLKKYSISLNDLDDFYHENKNITLLKDTKNNTLPELYAECLAFLSDSNVPEGLYAVVDIGGATVDMAVFNKTSGITNKNEFGIISKCIEPLGIEILTHKISKHDNVNKKVKNLLKNNFQSTDIEYNKDELNELSNKLCNSFSGLAIDAKDKFRDALIKRKGEMKVILCGGGAKYKWYKCCIFSTQGRIRNALADEKVPNGFSIKFEDIDNLGRYYHSIDHRLIISSGLVRRFENIPPLDGFPWDYEKIHSKEKKFDEKFDDIQNEKFGKIN